MTSNLFLNMIKFIKVVRSSSFWIGGYLLGALALFFYSYSQVDLNLTLSSNPSYQSFQQLMTQLGYFQRPISTSIYLSILIILLISYYVLIYQAKMYQHHSGKYIKVALITSVVLFFAYPAFSHDVFNYIFDTRILLEHGKNPYLFTALDFPEDLWTRFMHWTHRTYPYGPTWLLLTIPFYLVGLGKFVLTLISFKLLAFFSYWMGALGIYWILKQESPKYSNFGLTLYLLNPLIVFETLVSAHLDAAMGGWMLFGLALVLRKKKLVGWFSLVISVGIKYVSGAVLPFLTLFQLNKITFTQLVQGALLLSYVLTAVVVSQREILPWYFIVPFGLTALIPKNKVAVGFMMAITPATLIRYAPYLYLGDYSESTKLIRNQVSLVTFIIFSFIIYFFYKRKWL